MDRETVRYLAVLNLFLLLIALGAVAAGAAGVLSFSVQVGNVGNVKTIGLSAYSDAALSTPLTQITWGYLDPNSSTNRICYVKNNGNYPVTLNMTTSDWSPENVTDYLTLTWNREGWILYAEQSVKVTLTLTARADIVESGITTFAFSITLIAYPYE